MGDVVDFPVEDVRLKQLEDQINKGVTDLEFKYNELDTLHEMLHNREQEAGDLEKDFDILIKEYIDKKGIEDTPALWLTYSRSCIVKATGEGEYEMIWIGDKDDGSVD
jgi:hypothetical protein